MAQTGIHTRACRTLEKEYSSRRVQTVAVSPLFDVLDYSATLNYAGPSQGAGFFLAAFLFYTSARMVDEYA